MEFLLLFFVNTLCLQKYPYDKNILQSNLSKPDPSGTKYFVRFRQDPDYSDLSFREGFLYCSCFDNKECLLLDGLPYIHHFISVAFFMTTILSIKLIIVYVLSKMPQNRAQYLNAK